MGLAELDVPHEAMNAGGDYGIVDDQAYRRKSLNVLVPTLEEDDGFVLLESNAIVCYLADQHGRGTLQPENPRQRFDSFTKRSPLLVPCSTPQRKQRSPKPRSVATTRCQAAALTVARWPTAGRPA